MRKYILYTLGATILLCMIGACYDDYGFPHTMPEKATQPNPIRQTIQEMLDRNNGLTLPVMGERQEATHQSRSTENNPRIDYNPQGLQIIWDSLKTIMYKGRETYWIPCQAGKRYNRICIHP